jgi:pyruvate,water dikinase
MKASGLRNLADRGFSVPETWVIRWTAYERYCANDVGLVNELLDGLGDVIRDGKEYAVRSSANYEDGEATSFAGQFKSVLRVRGKEGVIQAAWSIWSSAQAPTAAAYVQKNGGERNSLKMGVIVQEMVETVVSGVAFNKNPMSGADEIRCGGYGNGATGSPDRKMRVILTESLTRWWMGWEELHALFAPTWI